MESIINPHSGEKGYFFTNREFGIIKNAFKSLALHFDVGDDVLD